MKYQKIKSIQFTIANGPNEKNWVVVEFANGTLWMPALIDLGNMISKIGKCEDLKYPHGKGYKYTQEFLNDCFNKSPKEIEQLYKEKYDPNKLLKK